MHIYPKQTRSYMFQKPVGTYLVQKPGWYVNTYIPVLTYIYFTNKYFIIFTDGGVNKKKDSNKTQEELDSLGQLLNASLDISFGGTGFLTSTPFVNDQSNDYLQNRFIGLYK